MPNTFLAVYGPKSSDGDVSRRDIGSAKVAAAKGTTQEIAISALEPEGQHHAHRGRRDGRGRLYLRPSRSARDQQHRGAGAREAEPGKEFDRKFVIRRSPAHMGVQMGEHNLVRWLDGFIFFNTMNGELDRLHRKYLDMPMDPLPTL